VRAAASLHISQPALSRSIQNLEKSLGHHLFERSSTGVVPTDLGRLYIERARDLLRLADELDREAGGRGNRRTGHVAVGGGPYPAESILGLAAARFPNNIQSVCVWWCGTGTNCCPGCAAGADFFMAEISVPAGAGHRHRYMNATHPIFCRASGTADSNGKH
jgi:hypothetical protein